MKKFMVDITCTVEVEANDMLDAHKRATWYDGLRSFAFHNGQNWRTTQAYEKKDDKARGLSSFQDD